MVFLFNNTNHTKSNTTFNIAVIAFAMMLVGGLVVVPVAVEQADAKCSNGFIIDLGYISLTSAATHSLKGRA